MNSQPIPTSRKKVIVIGAGFAGLSAAAYLSNADYIVEVIEASSKPGGRAYSFVEKETGTIIDNGQHILMGCYNETLNFLKMINALDKVVFQKSLRVNFLKENFNCFPLIADSFPYPFNLLKGLLNYKAISFADRLKLSKFFLKIPFSINSELNKISVEEWLNKENQNEEIKKSFWEILAIAALNANINQASAKVFSVILKEIFFKGNKAAAIVLPGEGLSEIYCKQAKYFVESRGGKIKFLESAEEFIIENSMVVGLKTSRGIIKDFDFVISAVPYFSLKNIHNSGIDSDLPLKNSAIVSIHIWLNENRLEKTFYGLINSPVHWIFNHGTHLTLVISDADYLSEKSKEEIMELCTAELKKYVGIERNEINHFKVIKEKRATFVPTPEAEISRPQTKTSITNLFFAGDWVNTGLPSTIESAVKSGRIAAEYVQQS